MKRHPLVWKLSQFKTFFDIKHLKQLITLKICIHLTKKNSRTGFIRLFRKLLIQ